MGKFAPRDVVVCIDARDRLSTWEESRGRLRHNRLYRIGQIVCGGRGVTLAGLPTANPSGWSADRFRKLGKADEAFSRVLRHAVDRVRSDA